MSAVGVWCGVGADTAGGNCASCATPQASKKAVYSSLALPFLLWPATLPLPHDTDYLWQAS